MYLGNTVFRFEAVFLLQYGLQKLNICSPVSWLAEDVKVKYKYTSVVPLVPAHIATNALFKQKNLHQASYKRFILPTRNRKDDGDSSMIALYNLSGSRSRPETIHVPVVYMAGNIHYEGHWKEWVPEI